MPDSQTPDLLRPFTPISSQVELLDRTLGSSAPKKEDPEQIARYLEARDDIAEVRRQRATPAWRRALEGAGYGALIGGTVGFTKAAPFVAAGALPKNALPTSTAALAGVGAATGLGLAWLRHAGLPSRQARARDTIDQTSTEVRRLANTPEVREPAHAYKDSIRAPLYATEAGMTIGGLAGAIGGAVLGNPKGPKADPILGVQSGLSRDQQKSIGWGGVAGIAAGGAIGLLSGVLMRARRRKALIEASRRTRAT